MTSLTSSAGGPLGHRQVRSLYPGITENHLRYLEKWGLLRHQSHVPRELRAVHLPRSPDDQAGRRGARARHAAARPILRALVAERQGQLQLDFQEARRGDRRAARQGRRARASIARGANRSAPQPQATRRVAAVPVRRSAVRARREVLRRRLAAGRRGRAEHGERRPPPTARR